MGSLGIRPGGITVTVPGIRGLFKLNSYRRFLHEVERPGRYLGLETNSRRKSFAEAELRIALAFPDTYDLGTGNLGLAILYSILNDLPGVMADRVFAPAPDMEEKLRSQALPLAAVESGVALSRFEIVGFTLPYELCYTNILNMLELGSIPSLASDRDGESPLVIAGGTGAFVPEPIAPFMDAFVIGDGEEVIGEIVGLVRSLGKRKRKEDLREALASIPGVYVPSLYRYVRGSRPGSGRVEPLKPGVSQRVRKRLLLDLDKAPFPRRQLVPLVETVHDRAVLEIMRGCGRGCRFCQAGIICRPPRPRSRENLLKMAGEIIAATGYDEISLLSLSSGDYPGLDSLLRELSERLSPLGVSLSLPSLRPDSFSPSLAETRTYPRRSGFTLAPETGSSELACIINKPLVREELTEAARFLAESGWRSMKLYFMLGLPGEKEEHLGDIASLIQDVSACGRKKRGSAWQTNVTLSPFVPKAHTPFQWEPMATPEEIESKMSYLRKRVGRRAKLKWHDPGRSFLEGVFARGGRELADVLLAARKRGLRLDGWSEHFSLEGWMDSFREVGLDPRAYACRERSLDEALPWEHVDPGVSRGFFLAERAASREGRVSGGCEGANCSLCQLCPPGNRGPQPRL